MTPDSLPKLVHSLQQLRLLNAEQLALCAQELEPRIPEPRGFARELVQRGLLTSYQVNELFLGRGEGLLLGSYVLLERIGEGGMGTVYKARNWKLDKLVALKVIKKDRLLKPDTIKRFYREIRAVAQLDHPNIVRAYDADEVNETHFFVMEYVEGTDLSQLVKSRGPLSFALACEYLRQAALGLQHAFERGLVHRDIKPHNLLLASGGRKPSESAESQGAYAPRSPETVKILDMGLALIETPTNDDDHSSTMTHSGVVMGTPDYMAPEQSMNAHGVDIRADLYSLGCTLYFLLTGRSPFAGGTLTQKLMRHQTDTPQSIKQVRPDVPDEIEALVQKLLAKRPEDRHQTPRELAQALEAIQASLTVSSEAGSQTAIAVPVVADSSKTELVVRKGWAEIAPAPAPGERPQAASSRLVVPMVTCLAASVLIGGGIWWTTRPGLKPEPTPVVEPKPRPNPVDKGEPVTIKEPTLPNGAATDEWVQDVQALSPDKQAAAVFAKLSELNEGFIFAHPSNTFDKTDNEVTRFTSQQPLTDLSPVRALKKLKQLLLHNPNALVPALVSIEDISPLKGLPLEHLELTGNRVENLSPLVGMPLTVLNLRATRVRDLTPLRGLKSLESLDFSHSPIADLSPLSAVKSINRLYLTNTLVADLKPLANVQIGHLHLNHTDVSDLSPILNPVQLTLSGSPVEDLTPLKKCSNLSTLELLGVPYRSLEPLKGLPNLTQLDVNFDPQLVPLLKQLPKLTQLNGHPVVQYWKVLDPDPEQEKWVARVEKLSANEQIEEVTKRMSELNSGKKAKTDFKQAGGVITEMSISSEHFNDLRFLTPLRQLESVSFFTANILGPLRPLRLQSLTMAGYGIRDLSPLAGMPLKEVLLRHGTGVQEVNVLRSVPTLRSVYLGGGQVHRLEPVAGLPLTSLQTNGVPRDLPSLKDMKSLESLTFQYDDFRHRDALRAMTWLKKINGKKPDDFWKDIAEQQVEFVRRELVRLNGELTKFEAKIDKGFVTTLAVKFKQLNDLRPLRTLTALTDLWIWGEPYQARPLSLDPLRGLPLDAIRLIGVTPENLDPLRGKKLGTLGFSYNRLNDLAMLKGVSMRDLIFNQCTAVADLSPLRGMDLESLALDGTGVSDLQPLVDMPLKRLSVSSCPVKDVSPLRRVRTLRSLTLRGLPVRDLGPLEGLPIESLGLPGTSPADLTPLRKLALLKGLHVEFEPFRSDADVLRAIPTLETINGKNAKEFLKEADDKISAFEKWCDDVARLPAKEQSRAVEEELKKRNPEFVGVMTSEIVKDQVNGFSTPTTVGLQDIAPLRAFPSLRRTHLGGDPKGTLANLYPLKGLPLEHLRVVSAALTDLSPLSDMKTLTLLAINACPSLTDLKPLKNLHLTDFNCSYTKVADLSPLGGMKLTSLAAHSSLVKDLTPLSGMPLKTLLVPNTPVRDLSPLRGMPLHLLDIDLTQVTDLSPLRGNKMLKILHISKLVKDLSPLKETELTDLTCDFVPTRDTAILKEIKTLKTLNGKPSEELLK